MSSIPLNSVTPSNSYSHPEEPVRHTYPLAVSKEGLQTALAIYLKTMPYILMRLGVLVGFTLAAIIWLALCGGIAALFSGKDGSGSSGGAILFLIGIGLPSGVFYWFKNYVLYLLKLGHVAVITKLITTGSLPEGVNQVAYGKEIVTTRFAQTNILFAVDSLVTGVTRAFNSTLDWLASLLPIPGLNDLMKVVNQIVDKTTTYIDETIFSYNLARGDENVWRSSLDGLVYYGQNVKPILKTAVWALILEYLLTFVLFLVCLAPTALIAYVLPSGVSGFAWLFAIALAFNIRAAALHPLFLIMVALTFHLHAKGQELDPRVSETLQTVSDKFRELSEKAKNWVGVGATEV